MASLLTSVNRKIKDVLPTVEFPSSNNFNNFFDKSRAAMVLIRRSELLCASHAASAAHIKPRDTYEFPKMRKHTRPVALNTRASCHGMDGCSCNLERGDHCPTTCKHLWRRLFPRREVDLPDSCFLLRWTVSGATGCRGDLWTSAEHRGEALQGLLLWHFGFGLWLQRNFQRYEF